VLHSKSHGGNLLVVAERERENLSERMKAGVARARKEGKHIGRPFREINWRKVDEYRAKGVSWSAVSRVTDIPYNTLLAAKARREEKEN
jgi:putative DNA-invertase from lambdoid prophage Rac